MCVHHITPCLSQQCVIELMQFMFLTDSFDDDKMYQVPEGWNIHSFSSLC